MIMLLLSWLLEAFAILGMLSLIIWGLWPLFTTTTEWWQSRTPAPATPVPTPATPKKRLLWVPWRPLRWIFNTGIAFLIIGGIIWIAFTTPGKELGKEILKETNSIKEGAIVYSTSLNKIEETTLEVPNMEPGYYRFRIYPQREQYAFSCANGGSGFGNPIPAGENIAKSDRSYGNILLHGSKTVASDAQPSGGNLILVQDDKKVIVSFNFPQEKKYLIEGCSIIGGLKMEFQFVRS